MKLAIIVINEIMSILFYFMGDMDRAIYHLLLVIFLEFIFTKEL